jgi:O-methyltransferase involved in polyketide biosynthesis
MENPGLHGIPETMLIPLWARAAESRRSHPIIVDDKAGEIVARLHYDFSRLERAWRTQLGVSIRSMLLDAATRDFLKRHPQGIIINLGAGLDTRFERLGLQQVRWYDLDVPEAIALRQRFFSEDRWRQCIAKSIFDYSWIDDLGTRDDAALFIAEGLLMYFTIDEVKSLLAHLIPRFPGAEMLVEVLGPLLAGRGKYCDSLKKIGSKAEFKWGLKNARELETWHDGLRFVEEWHYFDYCQDRWGWAGFLMRLPPLRSRLSCRIVHLQFT